MISTKAYEKAYSAARSLATTPFLTWDEYDQKKADILAEAAESLAPIYSLLFEAAEKMGRER